MTMTDREKAMLFIIILLLLIIGTYGITKMLKENRLKENVVIWQSGYNNGTNDLILNMNKYGQIPVIQQDSTMKLMTIQEICGAKNEQ